MRTCEIATRPPFCGAQCKHVEFLRAHKRVAASRSDVDTAVKWEKQSEGARAASRARKLREEMAQQRAERRAKQLKEGWGEVAKKSEQASNGAHSARSDSDDWNDLF